MCACLVTSVVSDSLRPHGPWPATLLCSWDSPGKNTGVGCHFLLHLSLVFTVNNRPAAANLSISPWVLRSHLQRESQLWWDWQPCASSVIKLNTPHSNHVAAYFSSPLGWKSLRAEAGPEPRPLTPSGWCAEWRSRCNTVVVALPSGALLPSGFCQL